MEPDSEPVRALLDDLAALASGPPWRLHVELLHHLVTVALDQGEAPSAVIAHLAVQLEAPACARLLERLLEAEAASERATVSDRWISEAETATDPAKAATIAAVAPSLADQTAAYQLGMGIDSDALWSASLLALGRPGEASNVASGEPLARVRAVASERAVEARTLSSDDAWWRAMSLASPPRQGDDTDSAASGRAIDDPDGPARAEALTALVGIGDGIWQLLALRARASLRTIMDEADRSGENYLAAMSLVAPPARVERHRTALTRWDDRDRAEALREATRWLTHELAPDSTASAPPPSVAPPPVPPPPPPPPSSLPPPSSGSPPRSAVRPRRRRGLRLWGRRSDPAPSPPHAESRPPQRTAERRPGVVSTGFAPVADPDVAIDPHVCLSPAATYLYWLEVGPRSLPGSIEEEPVTLPEDVPAGARLTVVLFAYDGGLQLQDGATQGVLELAEGGTAVVVHQPDGAPVGPGDRRLRFPVLTPTGLGPARLRCSIYHRGVLVQSRVVTAEVRDGAPRLVGTDRALVSVVDYRLFRTLGAAPLARLSEHRASLLLNDSGGGTHNLRFAAVDGHDVLTRDVSIAEGAIGEQIRAARGALRRVSWDSDGEWSQDRTYRYRHPGDQTRLTADLVSLAANGARFFQLLVEEVATTDPDAQGPPDPYLARDRIAEVLRRPGRVQIALQRGPHHILPAGLIYDHWLTDSAPSEAYRSCEPYLAAVRDGLPLEQAPCFLGDCPQAQAGADPTVVCPSGFWGFRHELGFPVTYGDLADATETIPVHGRPSVSVAASTELASATTHLGALRDLMAGGEGWRESLTRDGFLSGLPSDDRQILYLYCHGGAANNVPYVRLGEIGARPITRLDLANARVRWPSSRPLVFLNGCHTTAVDPETALDFVRFFVGAALASGVVGTEITIFEELGEVFGQRFMERFLAPGTTIGAAIRGARLDLLATGNPLGLVYIPFAPAGLQLGGPCHVG